MPNQTGIADGATPAGAWPAASFDGHAESDGKRKNLAILPRGGLGDLLYHALFARHVQSSLPFEPVLLAPSYGKFLTSLLGIRHLPVSSLLTDAGLGLHFKGELAFFKALKGLRGSCLASFTNDIIDHGLARLFQLSLFDGDLLGNSTIAVQANSRLLSRAGLNRALAYHQDDRVNPKHIVDRQRQALLVAGKGGDLVDSYRDIWLSVLPELRSAETDHNLVLIFTEAARAEKHLTFAQVEHITRQIRSRYRIRIFTREPERYAGLGVETIGFEDRLEPLRQIQSAAAVITADTFAAHLSGLTGIPTYVIYNFAYRPVWCEYWGSPYPNVFNFEYGECYQLGENFQAHRAQETSLIFSSVLQASELGSTSDLQALARALSASSHGRV